jgi:MFS family permease
MYLLSSLAEFVGYFTCHINDVIGRKRALSIFFALSGFICLSVIFVPDSTDMTSINSILIIVLASIGKASASAASNSTYVYTSHLYPTKVRNTFMLFIASMGRVGSIISPQINLLGYLIWRPLPYIIFSTCSLIASLFIFILPDPEKLNFL